MNFQNSANTNHFRMKNAESENHIILSRKILVCFVGL